MSNDEEQGTACTVKGCTNKAVSLPRLLIYPSEAFGATKPAEAIVALPTCADHKPTTKASDILTDDGWAALKNDFERRGLAPPVRHRTQLDWVPIDGN